MRLTVVVARTGPAGRLREALGAALDRGADRLDLRVAVHDLATLHLASAAAFAGEDDGEALVRELAGTDAVLLAADAAGGRPPAALDRLLRRTRRLVGVPAGLVLAAATETERIDAEALLRDRLAALGAVVLEGTAEIASAQPASPGEGAVLDALLNGLDDAVHRR